MVQTCSEQADQVLIWFHPTDVLGGVQLHFCTWAMATRFLPNVHVQNVQKCTKYVFSCLEVPWIDLLAVANLQ